MKKFIPAILSLLLIIGLAACGDDDDDKVDMGKTKTVTIEVDGSENLVISHVVIANGEGETESFTSLNVNEWSKQITYKGIGAVAASGTTSDGQPGTMFLRIVENGTVVKESKATGNILTANATY